MISRHGCEPVERRAVAIHAEHAFGDDQTGVEIFAVLGEQGRKIVRVVMAEGPDFCTGRPRAHMHRGMTEFINNNQVTGARQRRQGATIGHVSAAEHAGRLGLLEGRQFALENAIEIVIAGDQPRCPGTGTICVDRLRCRGFNRRMMGKAEIIVTAERDKIAPGTTDMHRIGSLCIDHRPAQAMSRQSVEFCVGEPVERFVGHAESCLSCSSPPVV